LRGEAEALSQLAHPSLVRCFDAVLDGERPHLVLELLDGPRLSTLERRYGIVVEQLLPLALQLCSALHYMHGRGWAHLDVKPRNIIMSSTPKLIDLSVALRFEDARRAASQIGTDAYMAPEQCDPDRFGQIGPTSDSWGLGVTLYEALAAEYPFPEAIPSPSPCPPAIRSSRTSRSRSTRTCSRRCARSCSPASRTTLERVRSPRRSRRRSSRSSPCCRSPVSAASGRARDRPDLPRRLYEDGLTPTSLASNRAWVFLLVAKESNG
jgi:serine/threonine protein kinase